MHDKFMSVVYAVGHVLRNMIEKLNDVAVPFVKFTKRPVATWLRIPIYIGVTWYAMFAFVLFGCLLNGSFLAVMIYLMAFFSVTLHEYGHILAARHIGHEATSIRLSFMGGVATIPTLNRLSGPQEIFVVAAGPAVNLALMALTLPTALLIGDPISSYMFVINAMLFFFNMLVAVYPMDGGRIVRGLLFIYLKDYRRATTYAVRFGQVVGCIVIALSLWFGFFMMAVIVGFVMLMGGQELKRSIGNATNSKRA